MTDTTITITIPAGTFIGTRVAGEPIPVHVQDADPAWLTKFFLYGVQRTINDKNGSMEPHVKLDLARALVADINAGKPFVGRVSTGGAPGLTPVQKRAHDEAKAFLKGQWATKRGLTKIAEYKTDEKAATFFKPGDSKTWDEKAVAAFIRDTVDHPKVPDFTGDAEAFIAALDVDFDDLGF